MITIRAFTSDDVEPVQHLLQELWGHDVTMLTMYNLHRDWQPPSGLLRSTLVATNNSAVVGVGTVFESTLHPLMLMVTINVANKWQQQGIGTALFTALRQRSDRRPWFAKLTRRDSSGVEFLSKRGFRPIVSTLTGLLDVRQEAVRAWIMTLPDADPNYRILNLDACASSVSLADVALVHAAVYRQFHTWNPPVEESVEQALRHYCGPEVIAGSHFCAYEDTHLIGASNLITNPLQPAAREGYLVNVGVIHDGTRDADTPTRMLVRRTLEFAAAQKLPVRFEADDTYVPHRTAFEHAPATEIDGDFIIMTDQEV
jgi:N-acetylglutamate synthase-like GNAT family acetyltransferase